MLPKFDPNKDRIASRVFDPPEKLTVGFRCSAKITFSRFQPFPVPWIRGNLAPSQCRTSSRVGSKFPNISVPGEPNPKQFLIIVVRDCVHHLSNPLDDNLEGQTRADSSNRGRFFDLRVPRLFESILLRSPLEFSPRRRAILIPFQRHVAHVEASKFVYATNESNSE